MKLWKSDDVSAIEDSYHISSKRKFEEVYVIPKPGKMYCCKIKNTKDIIIELTVENDIYEEDQYYGIDGIDAYECLIYDKGTKEYTVRGVLYVIEGSYNMFLQFIRDPDGMITCDISYIQEWEDD